MTRDTVIAETPATRATSSIVVLPRLLRLAFAIQPPETTVKTYSALQSIAIRQGPLSTSSSDRYAGWRSEFGQQALRSLTIDQLADHALEANSDVRPPSGRQEYLENLINRFSR
jgi:hypothetical protein